MNSFRIAMTICSLAIGLAANAEASTDTSLIQGSQLHVQGGLVDIADSSAGTSGNTATNAVELNYELFTSSSGSFELMSTFAYDLSTSQMNYFFVGAGKRYYLWSDGLSTADGGITPSTWQYFVGGEAGLSQDVARQITSVLSLSRTMVEFGGNVGIKRQLTPEIGVELTAGAALDLGISTVGGNVWAFRGLLGVSRYF